MKRMQFKFALLAIAAYAGFATYVGSRPYPSFPNGCSYCEERYLLPVTPLFGGRGENRRPGNSFHTSFDLGHKSSLL